ncbi:hypothetical protein A8C56_16350 [Niabella ginsenosidivorans]|uniref:Uncharacterized protein n=2 Tax=Niabella ginsenosidivorans TaxID=1176587 RepID=A0A1A9I6P1_9BACT|nr:hypothetical protein A8C56_16350 [Niabella ginsenosidivorans]
MLVFSKIKKNWYIHLIIFGLIYAFIAALWISLFIPQNEGNYHRGDPDLGAGLLTLFITPILVCVHIIFLLLNRKEGDRRVLRIHVTGLIFSASAFLFLGIESGFFTSIFR